MKKEILRINNLNYNYSPTQKLERISLCFLEGESIGFAGLTYSGRNLLARFLHGDIEESIGSHSIYIEGKKILNSSQLKEKVYRMAVSNYIIEDWSVAEYIGLIGAGWLRLGWNRRTLEMDVAEYFDELDIPFDVSRKVKELTELEKRIVDLVKASRSGAKIILIEDEFEGLRPQSIRKFGNIMRRVLLTGMTAIINTNSDMVQSILSDKYVIFKKGCVVKKCKKEYIKDSAHMESFLLDSSKIEEREIMKDYNMTEQEGIVYRVRNLYVKEGSTENFDFMKGSVVTFLVLDGKVREHMFLALSGRWLEGDTYCVIGGNRYDVADYAAFIEEKVVSVMHMGSDEEVLGRMTVGENLMIPSLRKLSSFEYMTSSKKIWKMLAEGLEDEMGITSAAEELEINELIMLTLERWYIYNPKVLVLLEPFAWCDVYGVAIVKSYIKKFASRGTAVIIIKSREEYIEDISDQIINID